MDTQDKKAGKPRSSEARAWLTEARERAGLTLNQAAAKMKISPELHRWLEWNTAIITHPGIADRMRKLYGLTLAERNSLVAEKWAKADGRRRKGKADRGAADREGAPEGATSDQRIENSRERSCDPKGGSRQ